MSKYPLSLTRRSACHDICLSGVGVRNGLIRGGGRGVSFGLFLVLFLQFLAALFEVFDPLRERAQVGVFGAGGCGEN